MSLLKDKEGKSQSWIDYDLWKVCKFDFEEEW